MVGCHTEAASAVNDWLLTGAPSKGGPEESSDYGVNGGATYLYLLSPEDDAPSSKKPVKDWTQKLS